MPRPKKPVEAPIKPVETPKEHSAQYLSFKAHIEEYAKANPIKYALKEKQLLDKLNTL